MRILILFILIAGGVWSQNFKFNQYTIEDGISQNFIYSIQQDSKGYLWVSTGDGLCRFDGKRFKNFNVQDGLSENIITTSFIDQNETLWLGHNSGGVSVMKNEKISKVKPSKDCISAIKGIRSLDSEIYFLSQNEGLFHIVDNIIVPIGNFGFSGFYAFEIMNDKNMLIGTDEGLVQITKQNNKWVKKSVLFKDKWITTIAKGKMKGVHIVAIQDEGISEVKLVGNQLKTKVWKINKVKNVTINSIFEDDNFNVWLGTNGSGVLKIKNTDKYSAKGRVTSYNTQTGLSSNFVRSIYNDREGNLWIGSFGEGLSSLQNEFFVFHTLPIDLPDLSTYAILTTNNKRYLGLNNGLMVMKADSINSYTFYTEHNGFVNDRVTSLYEKDNSVWIGTLKNGVFEYDKTLKTFIHRKIDSGTLSQQVNQISGRGNLIWIATHGGLYRYNTTSKEVTLFDMSSGLSHNAIISIEISKNGAVFVGTFSRNLFKIHNEKISKLEVKNTGELEIVSISEDFDDNIWIATSESGIFRYDGIKFRHYTEQDGLYSNYTYSIHHDKNGNIWVGHQGGLSKLNVTDNQITVYNHLKGINGQMLPRAMFLDNQYSLWIGGEYALINYNADDENKIIIAPVINLTSLLIDEKLFSTNNAIELPYGNYRIQFEFIGISFKNPDSINYKFVLEGHDKAMSKITSENFALYGNLSDGEYKFKVYAFTKEGVISEKPAFISIVIDKPFWKKAWFILLVIGIIGASIYYLFDLKTRRYKKNELILQNKLQEKTKEVVEKAEKIEVINKDITDSINYAKRIQSSILPDIQILTDHLPESFIFFEPRNIVSGDFYFIEKHGNKIIVASVDCTGHGVPGAFMSMIGSVSLRNIYNSFNGTWKTPDEVLELLDKEVKTLLQQNTTDSLKPLEEITRDGMDLTLCEICLENNEVLYSSARRSIITVQNGEIITMKGDRRSIGDTDPDSTPFTLHKLLMAKGDSLFLFTDGFTDQFGGPRNKKLNIKGTREIIERLQTRNKNEYFNTVSTAFFEWKAEQEQTDDVLFIGIQF